MLAKKYWKKLNLSVGIKITFYKIELQFLCYLIFVIEKFKVKCENPTKYHSTKDILWKSAAARRGDAGSNVYKARVETVTQRTLRPRNRIRAPLHLQKVKRPGVEFSCFRWALTWKRVRDFFRCPVPKSCNERLPAIPAIKRGTVLTTKGGGENVDKSARERVLK